MFKSKSPSPTGGSWLAEAAFATLGEAEVIGEFMDKPDETDLEQGVAIRAENAILRKLHALLKAKDPGYGGLVRVLNKRQEFLWVHERFAREY